MKSSVFATGHYLEIGFGVVLAVVVYVMNTLVLLQFSPNHFLGYENVFHTLIDAAAGTMSNEDANVALCVGSSTAFPPVMVRALSWREQAAGMLIFDLARFRAEVCPALHVGRPNEELRATCLAGSLDIFSHARV